MSRPHLFTPLLPLIHHLLEHLLLLLRPYQHYLPVHTLPLAMLTHPILLIVRLFLHHWLLLCHLLLLLRWCSLGWRLHGFDLLVGESLLEVCELGVESQPNAHVHIIQLFLRHVPPEIAPVLEPETPFLLADEQVKQHFQPLAEHVNYLIPGSLLTVLVFRPFPYISVQFLQLLIVVSHQFHSVLDTEELLQVIRHVQSNQERERQSQERLDMVHSLQERFQSHLHDALLLVQVIEVECVVACHILHLLHPQPHLLHLLLDLVLRFPQPSLPFEPHQCQLLTESVHLLLRTHYVLLRAPLLALHRHQLLLLVLDLQPDPCCHVLHLTAYLIFALVDNLQVLLYLHVFQFRHMFKPLELLLHVVGSFVGHHDLVNGLLELYLSLPFFDAHHLFHTAQSAQHLGNVLCFLVQSAK